MNPVGEIRPLHTGSPYGRGGEGPACGRGEAAVPAESSERSDHKARLSWSIVGRGGENIPGTWKTKKILSWLVMKRVTALSLHVLLLPPLLLLL